MITKNQPASPLPFKAGSIARNVTDAGGEYVAECGGNQDAAYIAHAANAYPKLVEALKDAVGMTRPEDVETQFFKSAVQLLKEIGE